MSQEGTASMEGKLYWFGQIAKSSWEISRLIEEPSSVIAINDLELQSPVGKDAWGSDGVEQPVHISVAISLRHPFKSSSDGDVLAADTIHYGLIKGAITHAVGEFTKSVNERNSRHKLRYLMQYLASAFHTHGHDKYLDLTGNLAKSSEFAIMLPKASALGTGVSLTLIKMYYKDCQQEIESGIYSIRLQLHDIKVPTLIGLLPKERLAKQNVVANIVLDIWQFNRDSYNDIEQVVVKTMEESSYQTLEALAGEITKRLIRFVIIPVIVEYLKTQDHFDSLSDDPETANWSSISRFAAAVPRLKVKLQKPGIYRNTTPGVELVTNAFPASGSETMELWKGYKDLELPPFPLQGSLENWIRDTQGKAKAMEVNNVSVTEHHKQGPIANRQQKDYENETAVFSSEGSIATVEEPVTQKEEENESKGDTDHTDGTPKTDDENAQGQSRLRRLKNTMLFARSRSRRG